MLPQFREYERCSTTVIDAYLSPLLGRYLGRLGAAAAERGLPEPLVMQSSGGVAPAARGRAGGRLERALRARPAARSAPACWRACRATATRSGFDMGGTSCDVCVVEDGRVRRTDSREIGGRVIQLPMVDVHTVGAGGGSIGWRDAGGALRVGPRRPAPSPGRPATGAAAPSRRSPTPTCCSATSTPTRRSPAASSSTSRRRATPSAGSAATLGLGELETAEGIVRVANQEMVRALRVVTVERGVDPRRFALMPFGGAGPMHAAALADELGIGPDPLPARQRRALGARPDRLRAAPRHGAHGDARAATS